MTMRTTPTLTMRMMKISACPAVEGEGLIATRADSAFRFGSSLPRAGRDPETVSARPPTSQWAPRFGLEAG